jgi:hypothetical protein
VRPVCRTVESRGSSHFSFERVFLRSFTVWMTGFHYLLLGKLSSLFMLLGWSLSLPLPWWCFPCVRVFLAPSWLIRLTYWPYTAFFLDKYLILLSSQPWATGWTIGVLGFNCRRGLGIFFTTASRTALGPTQTPIQWVPGALSLGVKRPGRKADHSPTSSAEVKNAWGYTSTPPIRLHGVVLS